MSRKRPYVTLREEPTFDPSTYSAIEVTRGAMLRNAGALYPDLDRILKVMQSRKYPAFQKWLGTCQLDEGTVVVNTDDGHSLEPLAENRPRLIFNRMRLNRIRHLNTFLNKANESLADGGFLWCHSRTSGLKRQMILETYPGFPGKLLYSLHFCWHRVCARLWLTRGFYMFVTKGKNRTYNRVELLGRMYRAGFEVIDERFESGEYYVLGRKVREPIWNDEPTNGILVKLNRVGYQGKMIGVYKFRTMYPYSEYLQPYLYAREGLAPGGKFAHDYRVNVMGRRLRGTWLDEVPMVINVLKGQMKLVGVRPLSRQYFSLYTPEMQALHVSVRPGLLPPFYYERETPDTIEAVQESERRYIEAWKKHPFATDWRYFWGILGNIIFKRKRSH